MTIHKITLGGAPDFVLRSGAIEYRHTVTVSVKSIQGRTTNDRFSNFSLSQVLRELFEKLIQFDWNSSASVEWEMGHLYVGKIVANNSAILVSYHLISGLSERQKFNLSNFIAKSFK